MGCNYFDCWIRYWWYDVLNLKVIKNNFFNETILSEARLILFSTLLKRTVIVGSFHICSKKLRKLKIFFLIPITFTTGNILT